MSLCFLSSAVCAEKSVVDITNNILSSPQLEKSFSEFYQTEKFETFQNAVDEFGGVSSFTCQQNHDSVAFDTVACYITYENKPSGIVWEFYYFLDITGWIGTNVGVIQNISSATCVKNVKFLKALSKGISYTSVPCT
ncbi:hypothetical protein [Alteromonas sp. ASW11-130]|uniref:hypothetical protein n=1 Tax=Alteromonas sp. ASW11-130 TaxID=3015775 RepID=UPI0022420213|nr:hypothetical protein [Alteromonas sp. ASW11-130]MCW8091872.1 hypothetical protein [Alteromonas sp. ASW11-130]